MMPLIISITVLVLSCCLLVFLMLKMKRTVISDSGAITLSRLYKLIITPGAVVFVFSILTIIVYKIK